MKIHNSRIVPIANLVGGIICLIASIYIGWLAFIPWFIFTLICLILTYTRTTNM